MVSYAVTLDVPRELIWFVSGLLAARRRQIGTRKGTRRLGCYKQALFGLDWFRDKSDIRRLGAEFGLPQSTAYRYLEEVTGVFAARAPGLAEALERALAEGAPYLILDGKVVDVGRCREKTLSRKEKTIVLWYAGKTHDFGGNDRAYRRRPDRPRPASIPRRLRHLQLSPAVITSQNALVISRHTRRNLTRNPKSLRGKIATSRDKAWLNSYYQCYDRRERQPSEVRQNEDARIHLKR